jgi:hypothetical protein
MSAHSVCRLLDHVIYLSSLCLAFIAIGHTAKAVTSEMKPFLDSVMAQIKIGLQNRGQVPSSKVNPLHRGKPSANEEPIFQCIGMLARAVGPNLTKLLHDQLDLMMACGLSEPLVNALEEISAAIPPLLKTIQGMYYLIGTFWYPNLCQFRPFTGFIVPASERSAIQAVRRPAFSGKVGRGDK